MGTGTDGLVAVDAAWADNADGRLLLLHDTCLDAARMAAKNDVWMSLDEEGVLHIAGRMVVGEVHGTVDVPVVLHLGSLGEGESQTGEDVDNLVLDNGQRMARAQGDGVRSASQVDVVRHGLLCGSGSLEFVDALCGASLEFIDAHAEFFLQFGRHGTEVIHEAADFTFLAKILNAQGFGFLRGCSLKCIDFFEQLLDFFEHIS